MVSPLGPEPGFAMRRVSGDCAAVGMQDAFSSLFKSRVVIECRVVVGRLHGPQCYQITAKALGFLLVGVPDDFVSSEPVLSAVHAHPTSSVRDDKRSSYGFPSTGCTARH